MGTYEAINILIQFFIAIATAVTTVVAIVVLFTTRQK